MTEQETFVKSLKNGDKIEVITGGDNIKAKVVTPNEDGTVKVWVEAGDKYLDIPPSDIKMFERSENEARLETGDKVWFLTGGKQPMTIKAQTGRYAICTAPHYRNKSVWYSILDFLNAWRAPNNLVFNAYDYAEQADIDECLKDLETGDVELSQRNGIPLEIDWERTLAHKAKRKPNANG